MDKLIEINEEILDALLAGKNADELKAQYVELYKSITLPTLREMGTHINRNKIKKVEENA